MARLTIARAALATAAALGLTLALAAPGSAETDVYHVDGQVGWLFDNVTAPREGVSDLERNLLGNVNGRLAEGFCADGEPDPTRVLVRVKDGAVVDVKEQSTTATIELYDGGGLDFFTWADTVYCPAWAAGHPIEPIATGVGNLQIRPSIDESGYPPERIIHFSTVVRGTVVTDDGERWAVRMVEQGTVVEEWPDEPGPPLSVDVEWDFFGIDILNKA